MAGLNASKAKYYPVRHIADLRDMLYQSSELYGPLTAFMQKENGAYVSYSFKQYRSDVEALGTALAARGYSEKKILLIGENCYAWVVSYLAVICGVGTIVPVDKEIPAEEIDNIIKLTGAACIIYSSKLNAKIEEAAPKIDTVSFDELQNLIDDGKARMENGDTSFADRYIDPNVLGSLIFTSGTTGVSKGVCLSHANICFTLEQMCQMIYIGPKDTFLSVLPLHHTYECSCGFLCQVYRGSAVAFSEGLRHISRNMQEVRPTIMLCVPMLAETMYKKIWLNIRKNNMEDKVTRAIKISNAVHPAIARQALKRKLFDGVHQSFGGQLRLLICGGAAADPTVLAGLRDFGILAVQGYGLTECAPLAAVNRDVYYNDESAGLSTPNGTLDICNVQEDGTGEIRYRGGNVMLGYYNQPKETAAVIHDGWFYTGDLGFIDPNGFLHITGRKKNVIVTANGKNIFPEELEAYLCRNPYIEEAVVVGIMNRKKNDYDIVALLTPNETTVKETLGENAEPAQINELMQKALDEVNDKVQSYKHLCAFIVWPEPFPHTSSKKIKRAGLTEAAAKIYVAK